MEADGQSGHVTTPVNIGGQSQPALRRQLGRTELSFVAASFAFQFHQLRVLIVFHARWFMIWLTVVSRLREHPLFREHVNPM
jgi:hypothetical protein